MADIRHPEPELEVLWQHHIPAQLGVEGDYFADDRCVDAVADLALSTEDALNKHHDVLSEGDLVVTISRRPL